MQKHNFWPLIIIAVLALSSVFCDIPGQPKTENPNVELEATMVALAITQTAMALPPTAAAPAAPQPTIADPPTATLPPPEPTSTQPPPPTAAHT